MPAHNSPAPSLRFQSDADVRSPAAKPVERAGKLMTATN